MKEFDEYTSNGKKDWNIQGVDMTINNSRIIYERIQLVIKAYDCDNMNCRVCMLNPICERKEEYDDRESKDK